MGNTFVAIARPSGSPSPPPPPRCSASSVGSHLRPSSSWLIKLRKVWTSVLILLPIGLAVLASPGHFLTSVVIAYQIQNTTLVVLSGALVYGLLTRGVTVRERRIALQNALTAREGKRQAQREATDAAGHPREKSPIKDESFIPIEEE